MIRLRLKFADEKPREYEIESGECLNDTVTRVLSEVHPGKYSLDEYWLVVVNGYAIDGDMWKSVALKKEDRVTISPKIRSGDAGTLFKTAALIAITVAASAILGPGGGYYAGSLVYGLEMGAVTIGASLLLNALIPAPVASADIASTPSIDNSQMYAISGQSNSEKQMQTCPKVYGTFRMFPNIAATPYTEIATSTGDQARAVIGNLIFTAVELGSIGNNTSVQYAQGGVAGAESVSVKDTKITVTYEGGVSTSAQIKTAIDANASATAYVSCVVSGIDTGQSYVGTTSLANGKDGGQTIQYLYAIYDFGMGTYNVNNLSIGDTLLSTASYEDFQYNFVDLNVPTSGGDIYDEGLKSAFQYYRGSREITSLSFEMDSDGMSEIQNSDVNTNSYDQEIILDFVCSRGLYGYSSDGTQGPRNIGVTVQFAPIGSSSWSAYNDLSAVDNFQVVGGTSTLEAPVTLAPTVFTFTSDAYYEVFPIDSGGRFDIGNLDFYVQPNINKLVFSPGEYGVGSTAFLGNRLLGIIQSADYSSAAPNVVVTLDRVVTTKHFDIMAYTSVSGGAASDANLTAGCRVSAGGGSGDAIITGMSSSPVYASIRFQPKNPGQYQVRVIRNNSYGPFITSTADSLTWGALTTAYFNSPIDTPNRHTFLELRIRATDQLNGNIATLSGICSSIIPVYDSDTQTWSRQPTSNPAWIFADLLTGEVNKQPIPLSNLDTASLSQWADFCDEIPDAPPDQTFTQPRYSCNFILDYQATLQDVLQQVGGMAQASLNLINGNYGVLLDTYQDFPVQIFTPRNSSGFSSVRSYLARPDGVEVTWIDPNTVLATSAWNNATVTAYDNGFSSTNAEVIDQLVAFGTTNQEQAWRFGRYMIAQNRLRQETITILVDFEQLACTRGDFVQITQDVMKAGGTPMRVKAVSGSSITTDDSIDVDPTVSYGYTFRSSADGTIVTSTLTPTLPNTFTLAGTVPAIGDLIIVGEVGYLTLDCLVKAISPNDDLSATLTLVEKADGIYSYESTDVLPDYNPQINPLTGDSKPPAAVLNLTVTDNTWRCSPLRSGNDYYVNLAWNIPNNSVYELFEVFVNDGTGYKSVGTTKIPSYTYFVSQDRLDIQHGFKVAAVSATGLKLQLAAMATVTCTPSTKPTPPADVSNFNMNITNQVIQLAWSPISDCDSFQYVLRYSPSVDSVWESSTPLAVVDGSLTSLSVQARTGTYFIKAIDYAGNQSVNAAECLTTVPNLFDVNDIDSIDDSPSFLGALDQTTLLGAAVILDEQVPGDIDSVVYYPVGYYTFAGLLDLGDIYSVRLSSLIQADGYKKGELMSDWIELEEIAHLNTSLHSDWNIALQYSASNNFEAMSDWTELSFIDHINFGAGLGFTDWRDIPTTGDATGRVFQFRVRMESLTANVTPRLFDTTVNADMPDRIDSQQNLTSDASSATLVSFSPAFKGPGTAPTIQISIDSAQSGDYWSFDSKALDGFKVRIYDKSNTQVVRQFDVVAKGFGYTYTATI